MPGTARIWGHEERKHLQAGSPGLSAAVAAAVMMLIGGCARGGARPEGSASASGSPVATSSASAATGAPLAQAPAGSGPVNAALDQKTETLYVTNYNDGTVSALSTARCNSYEIAGCARRWPVAAVGMNPVGVAVDQAANTVYMTNSGGGTVSVINGATCTGTSKSGCRPEGTVRVGTDPAGVSVDRATNTIYVTNTYAHANAETGTVSVVDGATCDAAPCLRLRRADRSSSSGRNRSD